MNLNIRISEEQKQKFQELCSKNGQKMTAVIKIMIARFIKNGGEL